MNVSPQHTNRLNRRATQFYSDQVLKSTEIAAIKAQAEAVVCERCGKQVHPSNWMKHQKSDHGDDPKPLHEAQKDDCLPLAAIRTDGGTQPRAAINSDIVNEYAESMNEGAAFPAIIVFFDGQEYWLADGFHRVNAALKLEWLDLPADVRQGTQRDAVLFSVGVNATHGLRRTNMDKHRAVERLLRDDEWSKWSNREIARRCGVDEKLVRSLRPSRSDNDQRTYTTKHGTEATMNTGNIGKVTPHKDEPPVMRPPSVSYSKTEDDYQDDVPSVDVDEDEPDDALEDKAANKSYFAIGDMVNDNAGHEDGEILELDLQMGALVKFPNRMPWWLKTVNLTLVEQKATSQARADLDQVSDDAARERLAVIVDQHEADAADRALRKANWQEHERLRTLAAQTPPPVGQYRTIVIDPPWPMKKIERGVRPNQGEYLDYPTMQLADIYNLGIQKLAADDGCHLYLWTTHKFLPEALRMAAHWGFRYNCLMTWVKNTGMTPYHFRFNTELVVFATRGSMAVQRKGLPLGFQSDSSGHSSKPDTFFDMVTQASPEPRLEMFARGDREGFTVWGNEVRHANSAAD